MSFGETLSFDWRAARIDVESERQNGFARVD